MNVRRDHWHFVKNALVGLLLAFVAGDVTGCSFTCNVDSDCGTPNVCVAHQCEAPDRTIGGAVSGLQGSGLVLLNNGSDPLSVTANGGFTFSTSASSGTKYAVTVGTQPSSPSQSCTVSGGTGVIASADVLNVAVTCSGQTFTIGGTVSGLAVDSSAGDALTLEDNTGEQVVITNTGAFTFPTPIASGSPYAVIATSQPTSPAQTCTVSSGSGTVTDANVNSIAVTCSTEMFTVGGVVVGLAGSGLTLTDNLDDALPVSSTGAFTFATSVASGANYSVTVLAQPETPTQNCVVTNGTGMVTSGNVTSVVVSCATGAFTIGGTLTGYSGSGLVLLDNGGDALTVATGSSFLFPTPLPSGTNYIVTVQTQPSSPTELCAVSNATGTVASADVTGIILLCDGLPGAPTITSVQPGDQQATVTWSTVTNNGGAPITGYVVTANPGPAKAATAGATSVVVSGLMNGTSYAFSVAAINAVGIGPASTLSSSVTPAANPAQATGVVATVTGPNTVSVSFNPPSDGGSTITSYAVTATTAAGVSTTQSASGSPYAFTGLTDGTTYTFTVTALNPLGSGPTSTPSNAVTLAGPISSTISTLTVDPEQVLADGISATTLTETLRDSNGVPVAGIAVVFGVDSTNGTATSDGGPDDATGLANTLTPLTAITDTNGVATARLSSTLAESEIVTTYVGDGGINNVNVIFASPTCLSTSFSFNESSWQVVQDGGFGGSAAGDFNNDGLLDLVSTDHAGNNVNLYVGNGNGSFQSPSVVTLPPQSGTPQPGPSGVVAGDFNNDGLLDLAVTEENGSSPGELYILIASAVDGGTSFNAPLSVTVAGQPVGLAVADFNNDGKLDVAVGSAVTFNVLVFLGNGDGTLQPGVSYPTDTSPEALAVGDFNNDGKLDLACANLGASNVTVLEGSGTGTFAAFANNPFPVGSSPTGIVVADINGDGFLDFATANSGDDNVTVMLGDGTGNFAAALGSPDGNNSSPPSGIAVGDLNGDGLLDLVLSNAQAAAVTVLLGAGSGSFQAVQTYSSEAQGGTVSLGDFNGDGSLDVAQGGSDVDLLINQSLCGPICHDETYGACPASEICCGEVGIPGHPTHYLCHSAPCPLF